RLGASQMRAVRVGQMQPLGTDVVDMLRPRVDQHDVFAGTSQMAACVAPHGPGADDRNVQAHSSSPCDAAFTLCWRSVLSGQLYRGHFWTVLSALAAGVADPGALEVVANADAQTPQPLGLHLDAVAVLERGQSAMVRAGREDVACLEGVDGGHPLNAARDVV